MDVRDYARRPALTPAPSVAMASQATFSGCVALVDVPRTGLADRLPRSISVPADGAPTCPCLIVFGEQAEGTPLFGGFPIPMAIRYHELMIALPFVRFADASGEYLFVARMICDFAPAAWIGNAYYGFGKSLARIRCGDETFTARDQKIRRGFEAVVRECDRSQSHALDTIRTVVTLPVLGFLGGREFAVSKFDWDLGRAVVEPVSIDVTIDDDLQSVATGCYAECGRAFRVRRMLWRVSWPTAVAAPP